MSRHNGESGTLL